VSKIKKAANLCIMNFPKSVAGAIFSSDRSSILLIQRRDVPVWVLPGGGIDPKESAEDAIVREILEETGFTVKVDRLVGDYIPINRLAKRTYLYECEVTEGQARLSSETRDIRFFSLDKIPLLPPPYLDWIQDAQFKGPPIQKKLNSVNYLNLLKNFILHPVLVVRFLLARIGLTINSK
jgi:8-oxo-dGTP diphosphatase